jgi:hypothetical protein
MNEYARCHFSITCFTEDAAVVHCLRALCHFAETDVKPQIAWGGTTISNWRGAGNQITLRFSSPHHRDRFVSEASRLLPGNSWREVSRSDNDPATRQRSPR